MSLELDLCCPIVKKLPDSNGELSATVSPEAIREANKEVPAAMEVTKQGNRKPYKQISDMLRASIGRYALENDNAGAVRKYSNQFDAALNGSTVQSLKKSYLKLNMKQRNKQR